MDSGGAAAANAHHAAALGTLAQLLRSYGAGFFGLDSLNDTSVNIVGD